MNNIRSAAEFTARNEAKKKANSTCVWHVHPVFTELDGVFITSCGRTVELGENESDEVYAYCPYCGKLIHWDHVK